MLFRSGRFPSGVGPFVAVGQARAYVEAQVGSSLEWHSPDPFFCPRCGDALVVSAGAWVCEDGHMELSKMMAAELRACFVERTREPRATIITFGVGGNWFGPGCGARATESDGRVSCWSATAA